MSNDMMIVAYPQTFHEQNVNICVLLAPNPLSKNNLLKHVLEVS